ncbi:hypothetical protein OH77DRAFT_1366400, partial [Trametes cingulata]
VTKFVNALSAASEVGGPAASAHLLGYPDHYTSHIFKTFYWKGYVRRLLGTASPDVPCTFTNIVGFDDKPASDQRIVLGTAASKVVAVSKADDYVYRPREFMSMCLWDYLRSVDIVPLPKRKRADALDPSDDHETRPGPLVRRLLPDHPRSTTHGGLRREKKPLWTLTFCGGVLPRPDRGDFEEYCCVMLALFYPTGWRRAEDILGGSSSWAKVFESTSFKDEHRQIMKHMNLLYECRDARDDYSA